jgi:hypothetical protein
MPALASAQDNSTAIPERTGLLRVLNNKELAEQDQKKVKRNQRAAEIRQNVPEVIGLANHIQAHWSAAKNTKWFVEERLLKVLRARQGKYDPSDLAHMRDFGGSRIFMMISNAKCRTIESWIKDVMIPAGDKPWALNPTPVPDLPIDEEKALADQVRQEVQLIVSYEGPQAVSPEMIDERLNELREINQQKVMKTATVEAKRVEQYIADQLTEGGFYEELAEFIKDFSTYPTAFLKGPIIRRKKMLVWDQDPDGTSTPVVRWKYIRSFERVNPFDIYVSPGSRNIQDGYIIERQRLRNFDLLKMKGVPGFDDGAIDEVLYEYTAGGLKDWLWTDQERANLEYRPNEQEDPDAIIEALEYHGDIPGYLLIEWGMDPKLIKNPAEPVPAKALMIGRWVIMARINENPFGTKPYYAASFDRTSDSLWGNAPPELMEDTQRICNAVARALVNNLAIASGPQVEVHKDRLESGERMTLYPWKVWKTKSDPVGRNREAVHFYQPNALTDVLMNVYQYFFGQAGEQLGVPAYEQGIGGAAGGAGKTAHGLSMLMTAASKIIKDAITRIDTEVIKPAVYNTWLHTLIHNDIDYQGDINIVARASEYLLIAEQLQARRIEFLSMTNNPTDMAIIGQEGRARVLRETSKVLKMDEDIVPTDRELPMAIAQNMQMMGMGAPMGGGGGGAPPGGALGTEFENPLLPPLARQAQF